MVHDETSPNAEKNGHLGCSETNIVQESKRVILESLHQIMTERRGERSEGDF